MKVLNARAKSRLNRVQSHFVHLTTSVYDRDFGSRVSTKMMTLKKARKKVEEHLNEPQDCDSYAVSTHFKAFSIRSCRYVRVYETRYSAR